MRDFIVKNKKVILTGILAVMLVVGGTYAWLTVTLNSSKVNILRADNLSLVLDESASNGVTISNAVPVRDSVGLSTDAYTFKLKNNGTTSSTYTIYLDDDALEADEVRMNDAFIKYSLSIEGETPVTATLPSIGTNPNRVLTTGTITANAEKEYSLRLWINQDTNNDVMGTTFRGKIRIEATQQ